MDAASYSSPSGSSPATRQSRRRRPLKTRERVRVTRACDRCKQHKIRCTGALPCEVCRKKGHECTYHAEYNRGRAPSLAVSDGAARASAAAAAAAAAHKDTVEGGRSPLQGLGLEADSGRPSPEPPQTDPQGHYVGPASGLSFLIRIHRRLHQNLGSSASSTVFTLGDAPLSESDTTLCFLPHKEEASKLVERYFDFAVPTHRFLHRQTIESWLDELYATSGSLDHQDDGPSRTAVLLMVFAQASLYMSRDAGYSVASQTGTRYFLAAEKSLQKERGIISLTGVQARLAQCFYLLAISRINHCWSLFGTTAHLAFAIGLNRGGREHASGASRRIEIECRRRVFWCMYTLDKYLAAALGRPRALREEDTDQPLPSCIDDLDLLLEQPPSRSTSSQPLMHASNAHVRLARILDDILRLLYPISPPSFTCRLGDTARCSKKLKDWYDDQASFLDQTKISSALLLPIYQRQRNVLNLAYWHAIILTHRPFLLGRFGRSKSRNPSNPTTSAQNQEVETNVQECVQASLSICEHMNDLVSTQTMFKAFWFTSYHAFCAVAVLYVYSIQAYKASSNDNHDYLAAATKCQRQLSEFAEDQSLARRYCLVLEELRKEVTKLTEQPHQRLVEHHSSLPQKGEGPPGHAATSLEAPEPPPPEPLLQQAVIDDALSLEPFDSSPATFEFLSDWSIFDSMVTSGLTNFGDFLDEKGNDL